MMSCPSRPWSSYRTDYTIPYERWQMLYLEFQMQRKLGRLNVCSVENKSKTRVGNIGAMEISALMWRTVRNIAAYFRHRKDKGSDLNVQLNRTREDDERHLSGQQRGYKRKFP